MRLPARNGWAVFLSGAGLPKNMYKSRKSVLLELLNIEICAILYNVYPKRKGNLTLLHYDAILFDVDGTLIDSAPRHSQYTGRSFQLHGR